MSTDETRNGSQPAAVSSDPNASRREPRLTGPTGQPSTDPPASGHDGIPSPGELVIAERTERRRQRTAARQARTAGQPQARRRPDPTPDPTGALTQPKPLSLRHAVSATSIAVLAAGGALGAILGALSAAGWVIGLLAAALTVILTAVLRRDSRSA